MPAPTVVTTAALARARTVLSLAAIAREAGIAVSTLHSKVERGTPLADDEARAIGSVLAASGITLATPRKAKGTHVQT